MSPHASGGFSVGINVFVIRDGRILLGLRRNVAGEGTWGLPGGHLEFGERMVAAAARELAEETGLHASSFQFVNLVNNLPEERAHYLQVGFIAEGVAGNPTLREPERCVEWTWFPLDQLPENIFFAHVDQIRCFLNNRARFVDG